jgi:hypothetical protein
LKSIDNNLKSQPQHFWNYVSNFRKHTSSPIQLEAHGSYLVQPSAVADASIKHFQSVYNNHCPMDISALSQSSESLSRGPISDADVWKAIKILNILNQLNLAISWVCHKSICSYNKHCPARWAYAARMVGKNLDIAIGAISLNHIL